MGAFADSAAERLRERLATQRPGLAWTTEHYVASTPVDLVGKDSTTVVCVEREWRRGPC